MAETLRRNIVQAVIAVILVGLICYLMIARIDAPKELWTLLGLIIGHYFGAAGVEAGSRSLAQLTGLGSLD